MSRGERGRGARSISVDREISLMLFALLALGCANAAVDLGENRGPGFLDAPAPEASSSVPQTIYEHVTPINGIALTDTTLYALIDSLDDDFELISCPLDRCRSERTTLYKGPRLSSSLSVVVPLLVQGDKLFWLAASDTPGGVLTCNATGCERPTLLSEQLGGCLTADADGVYWVDANKKLMRLPTNADVPEAVRDLAPLVPWQLSAHGDWVYFSTSDGQSIRRVRKDGGGEVEAVTEDESISGISAGDEGLFYASQLLTGRIARCAFDGCSPAETVAAQERWPDAVELHEGELFWLTDPRQPKLVPHATLASCALPDCSPVRARVSDVVQVSRNDTSQPFLGSTFAVNQRSLIWLERYGFTGTTLRRSLR